MFLLRSLTLALFLALGPLAGAAHAPAIAAAATLRFALTEVAARFHEDTGRAVRLSFGSSGNFAHQIEQGAPFELFLSADENFVLRLAEQGLALNPGALYAVGRVVLFVPHGSTLTADRELRDLSAALADGRLRHFAIANPDHAPYGRAARAVLRHAGIWSEIEDRLVLGENASQAMQFAAAGSSQGGIVPLALARAGPVASLGSFALIPADWHAQEPLRQRMALLQPAGETARAFYDYLQSPVAREIFARYGFLSPASAAY